MISLAKHAPRPDLPYAALEIDLDLIRRYDRSGPRYTSYPTADRFVDAFDAAAYAAWAKARHVGGMQRPLSLYVHIPFCNTLCFYCACNKIITKDRSKAEKYLLYLETEIAMQAALIGGDFDNRRVEQLHFGGGTPTFLSDAQIKGLMRVLRQHFKLASAEEGGEFSIEIDPRKVSDATVAALREMGFNRISIGVQDFDAEVQQAVHRIQSEEETLRVMAAARREGFKAISMDLIYGLPKQSVASFKRTLDKVIKASPDRISLFNYAHLPQLFKPQRRINAADLPSAETRLDIMQMAIEQLTAAGYAYIGMDHFAKPGDELAVAQRQGRLHRNFQGYSTHAECDLLALGVSAISGVGPTYSQNYRTLDEYYDSLDRGVLPVMRGIELTADDLLRRAIIQALMCHFELSVESIESAYLIDFKSYFADELAELKELEEAGLIALEPQWLTVTPKGRLLIRRICMVFDRYLRVDSKRERYSKII